MKNDFRTNKEKTMQKYGKKAENYKHVTGTKCI